MKFSRYTCEDQFLLYFAFRFFFISSDLAHRAPITTSVAVRLFAPDRDSCVLACFLWSTPGLASMKHFAILSSNTYEYSRGVFFHLGTHFFSGMFFFNYYLNRANFGLYWYLVWSKQTLFLPIRRRIKNNRQKNETKKTTADMGTRQELCIWRRNWPLNKGTSSTLSPMQLWIICGGFSW